MWCGVKMEPSKNVSIQASACRCLSMSADAHHRHHQHHRHHLRRDVRAHENHVSLVDKLGCGLMWVSFLLHDIYPVQPSSTQSGCLELTTHFRKSARGATTLTSHRRADERLAHIGVPMMQIVQLARKGSKAIAFSSR